MPPKHRIHGLSQILGASLVSLIALLGCASSPKTFEIKAEADSVINRDISGKPLSVVVHVYQLKDAGEFSKLTFDTLASGRSASDLLGKDLLEKNEVMLVPGAKYVNTDKIHEEARHIGVVAFFRQPDPHYWRLLIDAKEVRNGGLNFRVQDCYLSLITPKLTPIPGQPINAPAACVGNENRSVSIPSGNNPPPLPTRQSIKRGVMSEATRQVESLLTKKP